MADLSGEFSRRSLDSSAGRLRREARRLRRDGFDRAAEQVALSSASAREQEYALNGGRSIRSAEGQVAMRDRGEDVARIVAGKRQQALADDAVVSGVAVSRPSAQVSASAPKPAFTPPGVTWDNDSNGVPDSIQAAQAATPVVQREGRINGMPASQAISQLRQSITKRDGADPISGQKPASPSLVPAASALRDVNRILESRNSEQLPAIGAIPETAQTPVSGLRQSVMQPQQTAASPTFESVTSAQATPVSALRPAQDRFNAILDETQAKLDADEQKRSEDRLFAGTPEQREQEAEVRKVSSLREQYLNLPLVERQRRARAESARRSAQGY